VGKRVKQNKEKDYTQNKAARSNAAEFPFYVYVKLLLYALVLMLHAELFNSYYLTIRVFPSWP
jgi:hypothetical protein